MNKITKIFVLVLMQFLLSVSLYAQKDVTQFLGIPVDGYKPEMIKKLKDKGYTVSPAVKDVLVGEFNGTEVNIHIGTNNNKVYRIMVCDANSQSEGNIKIRFNRLCQQFQDNKKYVSLSETDYTISEDENISYGISVKKKRYEAVFYQVPDMDSAIIAKEFKDFLLREYTEEQISNLTEEEVQKKKILYALDKIDKKSVWFMISEERYGKYYITMFYDNEYNRASGEDL